MLAKIKALILCFATLAVVISCGGSPTGSSGSSKFEGVPSGEIVPVEKRDSVLTGVAGGDGSFKVTTAAAQKWWLQKVSKIDYTGCTEYEDEEITAENTYFGFKPNGGLYVKKGQDGAEQYATSWEWTDESKSAITIEKYPDIEFELTALNDEELIYASLQQGEGGCSAVTWEQFSYSDVDGISGGDGSPTAINADFSMRIEGPIGLTGMYLDEVDIKFNNRSSNSAVEFEWCWSPYEDASGCEVFSTDSDPSHTFMLENDPFYSDSSYITVILTAKAEDGTVSIAKKRKGFRMLEGLGTVKVNGEVHEVDDVTYVNGSELVCSPQGYPLPDDRPPYTEITFDEIHLYGAPEPLTLRLAGEGDILTLTPMYSTSKEYPVFESEAPNRRTFYIRWNHLSSHTYEDPESNYSNGSTTNFPMEIERNDVLETIDLTYNDGTTDIEISLRHVPHYATIYPDWWDPEGECRI